MGGGSVSFDDVLAARRNLEGYSNKTPVLTSTQANKLTGAELYFKCENFQKVGAFKFRGAFNAIANLSAEEKKNGAISFSSGNHAQAMALAGKLQGVSVTIVMPHDAPKAKLEATKEYGAEVIIYNRKTEDRLEIATKLAEKRGLTLIPPYDHRDVIAGQGTAALELMEEVKDLDLLFVCVGGGGLIAGCSLVAKHLAPNCKVYGVEPEAGNDVQQSLRSGKRVTIAVPDTIADGAQTLSVGELNFPIIQQNVDDILTVSDEQLCQQMLFFMERMKIVVEPTGCLAAAAAMNKVVPVAGKKIGIIISGGNVDPLKYGEYLSSVKVPLSTDSVSTADVAAA